MLHDSRPSVQAQREEHLDAGLSQHQIATSYLAHADQGYQGDADDRGRRLEPSDNGLMQQQTERYVLRQ
jgi:hypothetical protein